VREASFVRSTVEGVITRVSSGDRVGNARDGDGMMEKCLGRSLSRGRRAFGARVGDGGVGCLVELNSESREGRASRRRPREVFEGVSAVDGRARVWLTLEMERLTLCARLFSRRVVIIRDSAGPAAFDLRR
jgi:hypothetical protein